MRKRYSDGVDQLFVVKGAKRTRFVRKSTETTKGAEAFQAYDEASIPLFTLESFKSRRGKRRAARYANALLPRLVFSRRKLS